MRTFAEKTTATQQDMTARFTKSYRSLIEPARAHRILHQQRTIGNQAVQWSPQANTQEIQANLATTASTRSAYDFSRIAILSPSPVRVQPKLTIDTPDDIYEAEADHVANQVMQRIASGADTPVDPPRIGRIADEDALIQTKQASAEALGQPMDVPKWPFKSQGRPLPDTTRAFHEHVFGQQFGRVRIHADTEADRCSRQLSARAFTLGHDVFFRRGEYRPESVEGQRLISHELTHVVQQGHAPRSRNPVERNDEAGTPDPVRPDLRVPGPRIQCKVSFIEGPVSADLNLAEQWTNKESKLTAAELTAVGYTRLKLNGDSMILNEPSATTVPTADGGLKSWITKIPENEVSYEVHIPQRRDSWCVTLPVSVIESAFDEDCRKIDVDDPNVIEALLLRDCKSIKGGGTGTVLVEPGDPDVPGDTERHEGVHVQHLRDLYDTLVLPWDIALQNHFGEENAIQGTDLEDLHFKYMRSGVSTAKWLFTVFDDLWGERSDEFHAGEPNITFWKSPNSTCALVKGTAQVSMPSGEIVVEVIVPK